MNTKEYQKFHGHQIITILWDNNKINNIHNNKNYR